MASQPPPYNPQPIPPTYNANQPPSYVPPNYAPPTQPLMGELKLHWGEIPQRHLCQFCNNNVVTEVVYESGGLTWLIAGGLCLFGCWLGCCLIPFAVDGCKDVVHICPHCHNTVGRKNRLS